jgi:serine/threonine protein kinase
MSVFINENGRLPMLDYRNLRLERYELRERIGAGGMARVFKAWDTVLERPVAVKILHDHLADDPNFKERFEREARLIASLSHPNIVQIYDFKVVENGDLPLYYMVMPLITGQTLRGLMAELAANGQTLSYARILTLFSNVADALQYAHSKGMIHRDVKPANILIDENGQAILTDFGIARMVESGRLTQEGVSTGTPVYMSPEQASGQPGDARSDLYALGVILFEMLTGRPPYEDEGSVAVMMRHLNDPIPPLSDFLPLKNPALERILTRALAKNPNDRYPSIEAFAAAFKQAINNEIGVDDIQNRTLNTVALPRINTTNTRTGGSRFTTRIQPVIAKTPRAVIFAVSALVLLLIGVVIGQMALSQSRQSAAPTEVATIRASSMTESLYFTSTFADNDEQRNNWVQAASDGFIREITPDGFYHLTNQRPRTAVTALFNPTNEYASSSISMTGTLLDSSNPAGAMGIAFRYQNDDHYNVFAVDGLGRYSIWVRDDGQWRELRGSGEQWTRDPIINQQGSENRLQIDILGNRFTGYVNGKQLFSLNDNTLEAGSIGIYVATHTSGITEVLVDTYQTFPPAPPSMTGG